MVVPSCLSLSKHSPCVHCEQIKDKVNDRKKQNMVLNPTLAAVGVAFIEID